MKPRDYVLLSSTLALFGCVEGRPGTDGLEGSPGSESTGISILAAVEATAEVDIVALQYTIERVACAEGEEIEPLRREVRAELQTLRLPGGIPGFEAAPLDASSEHKFADHFEVLPAGCYDVAATPLTAEAAESQDCAAARSNGVQVRDGETTEIMMLSQCKGPEVGALDAAVAFNQPPQLINLTYSPSKFVAAGQTTTVCATASDPDNDPLEFEWNQISGAAEGESILSAQASADNNTQCAEIAPNQAGNYMFEVRIFDLLRNETNDLIRVEQLHAANGSPNLSNDSLRFPVYAAKSAEAPEQPEGPEVPEVPEVTEASQQ